MPTEGFAPPENHEKLNTAPPPSRGQNEAKFKAAQPSVASDDDDDDDAGEENAPDWG